MSYIKKERYMELIKKDESLISLDDKGQIESKRDRTLWFGYNIDGSSVHVYLEDELLCGLIYNDASQRIVKGDQGVTSLGSEYIPTKRCYPEGCDVTLFDNPLFFQKFCFGSWDDARATRIAPKTFHGKTIKQLTMSSSSS